MDGKVKYNSLREAAEALVTLSGNLDDPIDNYMTNSQKIGEDGAAAWGGDSAEDIVPVLSKIKDDIVTLQSACSEFSRNVSAALERYEQADASSENDVNGVVG